MHLIENASIIGRTIGEQDLYLVQDETTGRIITLVNANNLELVTGAEGLVSYETGTENVLIGFEPATEEVFA